jgi:hypothetical protein
MRVFSSSSFAERTSACTGEPTARRLAIASVHAAGGRRMAAVPVRGAALPLFHIIYWPMHWARSAASGQLAWSAKLLLVTRRPNFPEPIYFLGSIGLTLTASRRQVLTSNNPPTRAGSAFVDEGGLIFNLFYQRQSGRFHAGNVVRQRFVPASASTAGGEGAVVRVAIPVPRLQNLGRRAEFRTVDVALIIVRALCW